MNILFFCCTQSKLYLNYLTHIFHTHTCTRTYSSTYCIGNEYNNMCFFKKWELSTSLHHSTCLLLEPFKSHSFWKLKNTLLELTLFMIIMIVSWRHQCLLLVLVTFIVLSKGSRLLKDQYWEQILPKKLPSPSSSPSRGTNYVLTTLETDHNILPTSDGKV